MKEWGKRIKRLYKRSQSKRVVVHPLFVLFLLFCFLFGKEELVLIYTLNAVIHEAGHFIVARRIGYDFLQLRLMPYGAELFGENDQFLEYDEVKIAIAGPLTNFLLCMFIVASWWIFPSGYDFSMDLCVASLVLGVFNLIPAYPLDGGRILVCVLSQKLGRLKAVRTAKIITQVFAIILFLLFLLSVFFTFNITLGFVAIMLFQSAYSQNKNAGYERIFCKDAKSRFLAKGIEECRVVVSEDMWVIKAYRRLRANKMTTFVVVDKNYATKFEISESQIISEIERGNWRGKIKGLCKIK